MSSKLTLLEYVSSIESFSNQPLNLQILLLPFGIQGSFQQAGTLLVGEFIDYLYTQYSLFSKVDPLAILDVVLELESFYWIDELVEDIKLEDVEDEDEMDDFEKDWLEDIGKNELYKALIR